MKTLDLVVANQKDAGSWNEFVKSISYCTPYHLWEYGDCLSSTYGYQRFYLVAKKDGEIEGILPLIRVKSHLFGDKLISLPFCEYGGPLSKSYYVERALLRTSMKVANQLKVDYVEIRSPRNKISALNRKYTSVRSYVTFRIDLEQPMDTLWSNLDKKTRNAVRKAMKSNIEIREGKRGDLNEYYELYLKTQKKHGSPPNDLRLFSKLLESMRSTETMKMVLATYQGRGIAGILLFQLNGVIYWWGNVSEPEYRRINPTNLLLWRTFESSHESGFKVFDFGRTRRETPVYHFKSGWSGKETSLQDYVYFRDGKKKELPDPSQTVYQALSKLWSMMPSILMKRIGPAILSGIGL